MTDHTSTILSFRGPLLSLAYTLTADRKDAYNLLTDTTRRAMNTPGAFSTRESLFAMMYTIFNSSYSARAEHRKMELRHAASYALPRAGLAAIDADLIPEGSVSADKATHAISSVKNPVHRQAMAMRAAGYRYTDIAREAGISPLHARMRVAFASLSLRALLSL